MNRRSAWLTVFAVAMGLLEAAVVVYLRELYYPEGFRFPLVEIPARIALVEIVREATTIAMLFALAMLAGRDRIDRFFVFAFLFGAWDLVYYLGLRLFLDWPGSLLDWDVLFLIPVPWVAPVLYPVLVSCLFVVGYFVHESLGIRPRPLEWSVAAAGALAVVASFSWGFREAMASEMPRAFPVALFSTGLVVGAVPFARAGLRSLRSRRD